MAAMGNGHAAQLSPHGRRPSADEMQQRMLLTQLPQQLMNFVSGHKLRSNPKVVCQEYQFRAKDNPLVRNWQWARNGYRLRQFPTSSHGQLGLVSCQVSRSGRASFIIPLEQKYMQKKRYVGPS